MKHGQEPDEWLMGQVALGKREFLAPLVRRYASSLLTYIERMVGDRHRAEELFQDVFWRVWNKRKLYKFPKSFRAWLFAIAANCCRADYRRARLASVTLDEASPGAPVAAGKTPLEAAIDTETATLVATAVAELPKQQRTVVVLRVWNGLSYAEIAEIVGRTEATVRSHMHHGLAAMRKYLEPRL
jgi:RNA polymerase sigma-70 factor (ECF subfamily)